jgi:non-ribosomal peptide synthetase component F
MDESARIATLARERRVTTNTLVSAAWALWLSRRTGSADVLFGVTVAGRPEAVQGIERLVGLCINNVPSRVRVEPSETLAALLSRLEERQLAAAPHSYVSLLDLQRWSGLPFHQRLFDTLLVFQHHGADDESADWLGASNAVRMGAAETQTNYPLALVVGGKDSLTLRLAYQGRFASAADVDGVLEELRTLLAALTALGDAPLGHVLDAMAPVERASDRPPAERVVVPPRSDVEWVVCQLWAELLGRTTVGVTENFFDLGGQSLVATQIVSRVRDAFHLELPISLLFEHPTVETFVRAVVQREAPGRIDRIAAIIRRVEEMTLQELREARVHE